MPFNLSENGFRFEHPRNRWISRLIGKFPKGDSVLISRVAKFRESLQKPSTPLNVAPPNRVSKVVQFDAKKAAHFAQIFDSPPGRSRSVPCVMCVDVRSVLNEDLDHGAVSTKRGIVQCRRATFIISVDEFRVALGMLRTSSTEPFSATSMSFSISLMIIAFRRE